MSALSEFGIRIALLGCLSIPVAAQTSAPPAAKKVWTNEDLESLRATWYATSPVSAPGELPSSRQKQERDDQRNDQADARERAKKAEGYRRQLQPLYAELPKIDAEIAEMERFEDGSYQATGGRWPLRNRPMPLNPADRIAQLTKRKDEIRGRIGDLEDRARHDGVLPGELR